MKQTFKRGMSFVLALMMVFGVLATMPFTAFAANDYTINSTESTDDYYNLISKKDWEIAPGITESEIVLNNDDGSQRQVLFVMEADLNNEYVKVINSYTGMVPQYGDYKTGVMSEQAKLAEELGYGNVVGAMNTTLSWYTGYTSDRVGEPLGFIMLDAEVLFDPASCGYDYGKVGFPSVLVINKDFDENGNPRPADIPKVEMPQITSAADLDGWEDQVIPCSSGYIVKDGVNQSSPSHTGGAPRSVVGIKADGTVVIMVNDGRQAPYSEGMSMYELAEVMLDLGCIYAVNCDGGGSTTWLSQRPGEELKVNNSPSDGAERETTTGILFISTAPATGEFVRANISSENDYYTPNSVVKFDALGTDLVGTEADIPADAVWQLADPSFGTIDNGVFTSNGKQGEVVVQIVYNGAVVGEDTIYIVMPDKIEFAQTNMVIPFGKTVDIIINATYDSKPVVIKVADVDFNLSNNVIGTISGFAFSSAPEGTEVEPAVLTATIGDLSITANISLGKGTEIAYDFEDQNLDGWTIATNYPQYGPSGSKKDENGNYYYNGQNELGYISVVDASTGKVRNGDYALAVEIDFTQIYETGFHSLNMRFPGIDTTDAVSVGFWIYVPYDARFSDMTINTVLGQSFFADGSAMDLCEGWHYVKLDAPGSSDNFKFYGISYSVDERASATDKNGNPYYDHITTPNLNGKYTFYIDDISVDYSTAVEDRENPVFSDIMVMDSVGSVNAVVNGQTIKFNNPTFEVKVSDFIADNAMGLNASSAKAYIDGKEVDCTFANGKISVNGVTLTDGVHTVKFEIYDNAGNSSWVGGSVIVDAGKASVVSVVPQNPNADRLLIGSLYWLDVKATDIDKVQKIELRFDLNNASYWELEGMNVALGFKAEWSVQADDNIATIVITRIGKSLVTGDSVIASIPVRTWESHITEYEGYEDQTPATLVKRGIIWAQSIEIVLEKGVVTYTDNTVDTFGMKDILVDTELFFTNYTRKNVEGAQAWIDAKKAAGVGFHEHTIVALDDKAATCTEAGYTGRTYCAVCDSVVDWGTIITANSHSFVVVGNRLTCDCGEEYSETGLVALDGIRFYAIAGKLQSGWQMIEDAWYYFDSETFAGTNGTYPASQFMFTSREVYYTFVNGELMSGSWIFVENGGVRYYYGPDYYRKSWRNIDGKDYYFDTEGLRVTGIYCLKGNAAFGGNATSTWYEFDADGALVGKVTGIVSEGEKLYYVENGILFYKGLFEDNGDIYYADENGCIVTGVYDVEKTNDILPKGTYTFGSDGKVMSREPLKFGLVKDEDGEIRYYVNGEATYAGVVQDAEGDLYYINSSLKAIKNCTYTIYEHKTNGLIEAGTYTFDAEGKLVKDDDLPEQKNGVVKDEDGEIRYYVNGEATYAGVVQDAEGNLYYINSSLKAVKDRTYTIYSHMTNGLIEAGTYTFNAEGKLVKDDDLPEQKNGVVKDEDGEIRYYVNGEATYAGVVQDAEGNLYYINSSLKAVKDRTYTIYSHMTNGLIEAGTYTFDAEGKLIR